MAQAEVTADTRQGSYEALRRRVLAFAALFSALIVAVAALGFVQLRSTAADAAERRAASYATILAAHLERVTLAIESRLGEIATQSEGLGGPAGPPERWRQVLLAARAGSTTIASLSIVDTSGVIRHSTLPEAIGRSLPDLVGAERSATFLQRFAQDGPSDTIANQPVVSPFAGRVLQPYSRRLINRAGRTVGAASATFDPESLHDFYRAVDTEGGELRILHESGVLLLREPIHTQVSEVASDDRVLAEHRAGAAMGEFIARNTSDGPVLITAYESVGDTGLIVSVSLDRDRALGMWRGYALVAGAILIGMIAALWLAVALILRQLSARVAAEAALAVQQQHLAEAQRLESLGQLTGGVAHDFNNLLTVILNSADALLMRVSDDVRPRVEAIVHAAENGAALVGQLLAFSRRQALSMAPVDVNSAVAAMEDMLRRTLGAPIALDFALAPDLWPAYGDRAQIESAVLNLVINARDAMPGGGRLTIETRNVFLDGDYTVANPDVASGDYVVLAVTDTGSGMTPAVMQRALEPFFTTKEVGKGSGLGLSMVFGFAKQSKGHLKIYSEVGAGTTVRLYLPRDATGGHALGPEMAESDRGGDETILVVEDEANVRQLASANLRERGYTIIEAANGAEAVQKLATDQTIHLLLTDMIMPGQMTGRDVAEHALKGRPDIKLLFTSGYADVSVMRNGLVKEDARFISKPYRGPELARVIRALLDS